MHAVTVLVVIRRIVLITILVLPQRFWLGKGFRLAASVPRTTSRIAVRAFLIATVLSILAVLSDRIFHKFLPPSISFYVAPIVQLWVFTSTFAYFFIKAVCAAEWCWSKLARLRTTAAPAAPAAHTAAINPTRRSFFRYAVSLAGSLPFIAGIYGFARERLHFEIVRVDVPIPELPDALDGLRIVQLSDIHIGDFMPREEIRRAVTMANSLEPHLAVITGDFITSFGDPLADCIEELSLLKAPLGLWGCNGNHEIYAGAELEAEATFRTHGMTLLRQAATQIRFNGQPFNLIGIDYQRDIQLTGSTTPSLGGIESLVRPDMLNILLSHNPNTFYRASALGIGLTLSGHTHGGQVNLEILNHSLNPARFMTRFLAGLYQRPMTQNGPDAPHPAFLYVNRGLGTLGIPARIGAAPEITLLTLHRAPSQLGAQTPR